MTERDRRVTWSSALPGCSGKQELTPASSLCLSCNSSWHQRGVLLPTLSQPPRSQRLSLW